MLRRIITGLPRLSLTLVDWFLLRPLWTCRSEPARDEPAGDGCIQQAHVIVNAHRERVRSYRFPGLVQRYFSFGRYRPGNRLQLDSRISALLGAEADYKEKGCSYCVSANPVAMCRQREPGPPIARRIKILPSDERHFLALGLVLAWIAVTDVTSPVYAILVRDSRRNPAQYECPDR